MGSLNYLTEDGSATATLPQHSCRLCGIPHWGGNLLKWSGGALRWLKPYTVVNGCVSFKVAQRLA